MIINIGAMLQFMKMNIIWPNDFDENVKRDGSPFETKYKIKQPES